VKVPFLPSESGFPQLLQIFEAESSNAILSASHRQMKSHWVMVPGPAELLGIRHLEHVSVWGATISLKFANLLDYTRDGFHISVTFKD